MENSYNSVNHILDTLDYQEIRPAGAESWKPLDEVNGHFGTTDDTQVISPGAGEKYARLEDAETGKCVALARKKSPGQSASDYAGQESDKHILDRLSLGNDLPNARTAAYLLGMTYVEGREVPDHQVLVTSANLAVLKGWAIGIKFTDLDAVAFRTVENGDTAALEIEGRSSAETVPIRGRSFTLEKPWAGMYSAVEVSGKMDT